MRLFLLVLAVVVVGCSPVKDADYAAVIIKTEASQLKFSAEIPQTPEDFMRGLMFREKLDDGKGMLFAYPDSAERSFWMKNTLMPLDMLFIDEKLVIRKIHRAVPCEAEPCPSYKSGVPVKYVLEIRGNLTAEKNIKEGDVAELGLDEKR